MPFNIGGGEAFLLIVIVLVIFGAGRLPEVLSQLGKGVREFQNAASGKSDVTRSAEGAPACRSCGSKLDADAKFCSHCGTPA